MGQMRFKRGYAFWIIVVLVFIGWSAGTENIIWGTILTAVTVGVLYILYILLARFFD